MFPLQANHLQHLYLILRNDVDCKEAKQSDKKRYKWKYNIKKNSIVFWVATPSSSKRARRFRGHCLHIQGRRSHQKHAARRRQFASCLAFRPWRRRRYIFRNYTAFQPIVTAMRNWNPSNIQMDLKWDLGCTVDSYDFNLWLYERQRLSWLTEVLWVSGK
jgi:hypothetical protein